MFIRHGEGKYNWWVFKRLAEFRYNKSVKQVQCAEKERGKKEVSMEANKYYESDVLKTEKEYDTTGEKVEITIYKKVTYTILLDACTATIVQSAVNSFCANFYVGAIGKEYTSTHQIARDAFFWLYGIQQYLNARIANYVYSVEHNCYEYEGMYYSKENIHTIAYDLIDSFTL